MANNIEIDLDEIEKIAVSGVMRTAVFMGLGLNAAYDKNFRNYELTDITQIQIVPPNADEKTITHYKGQFGVWIIMCGLRELTETFAVYLDRIQAACSSIALRRGKYKNDDLKKLRKKFLYKGIKGKLELLEEKFGIKAKNNDYLISISQVRNCFAHRRGIIGSEDCTTNDELVIRWKGIDLFIETSMGEIIPLNPPLPKDGTLMKTDGHICLKFVERMETFKEGTVIKLSPRNLAEICNVVLWSTGEIKASAIEYAKSIGIAIKLKSEPSHNTPQKI